MGTIRTVTLVGPAPRKGATKLCAYGYQTIARLCGMTEGSVRKAAQRRRGNPPALVLDDLVSVARFLVAHGAVPGATIPRRKGIAPT